jgi:ADP-ribose pyrophosphatase
MSEKKSENRVLGQGRFVRLMERDGWEYAERLNLTGIVIIVAITDDGKLLLTEQYRFPVGAVVVELPAGLAGDSEEFRGEPLENAARRELLEEVGYEAKRVEFLTEGPPSAGVQTEIVSFFLATGLKKTGAGGGHGDENIVTREVPLAEARAWLDERVKGGEMMVDPKVYAGLYFAQEALAAQKKKKSG